MQRLRNLECDGVINRYRIDVDAEACGLPVTAMARISLERHSEESLAQFEKKIRAIPEVLECLLMTALSDYLLRVILGVLLRPSVGKFAETVGARHIELPRSNQCASGLTRTCFGGKTRDESANQFGHVQCADRLLPILDNIGV